MTHLIIPHSDKLRVEYGDSLDGNVDPLVLGHPWYYSFCQGDKVHKYLEIGSVLFFCSSEAAQTGILKIDTVFVVGDKIKWSPGISRYNSSHPSDWERDVFDMMYNKVIEQIRRKNPCSLSKMYRTVSRFKKYHLLYGFRNSTMSHGPGGVLQANFDLEGHRGRYTYVAQMWKPNLSPDEKYSFLPVDPITKHVYQVHWPPQITNIKKNGAGFSEPIHLDNKQMNSLYIRVCKCLRIVELQKLSVKTVFH